MQLAHLNWQEAEKVLADPETLVVIPVGSTEQHGPISPLGTDWLIPEEFCRRLDGRMEKLLIAPVIPFGVATHHINFPGTIDLGIETMIRVMSAVFESLYRHGARRFAVINGHGGNDPGALGVAGLTGPDERNLNYMNCLLYTSPSPRDRG